MRFGTVVRFRRGGAVNGRIVRGVLVGARGHNVWIRLLHDDPGDTVGWNKAGQVGHWSRSAIVATELVCGLSEDFGGG